MSRTRPVTWYDAAKDKAGDIVGGAKDEAADAADAAKDAADGS